jgi:hypothetical protein
MDLPSFDVVLKPIGYGVLLPAAVTGVGLMLGARPRVSARGGQVLAVAAGLVAGFLALAATGQLTSGFLKPDDTSDCLPGLALLACAAGIVERLLPEPFLNPAKRSGLALRWAMRLGIGVSTGWVLVRAQSTRELLSDGWIAALALAVTALWGLDSLARRWSSFALPVLLALIAFGTAALIELCGFMSLAQMGGVLAAVLTGCAAAGWLRPHAGVAQGAVPAFAVLLPGLLFASNFNNYNQVSSTSHLLVLAAPLILLLTAAPPIARLSTKRLTFLRAAVVLLPLAKGLSLAAWGSE